MKRILAGLLCAAGIALATVAPASAMTVAQEYGWYDGGPVVAGNSGGGGEDDPLQPGCGTGTRTLCKRITTQRCVEWFSNGGTIGVSATGGTVGFTWTCKTQVTTEQLYYYP